jgi:hypothetical protein
MTIEDVCKILERRALDWHIAKVEAATHDGVIDMKSLFPPRFIVRDFIDNANR